MKTQIKAHKRDGFCPKIEVGCPVSGMDRERVTMSGRAFEGVVVEWNRITESVIIEVTRVQERNGVELKPVKPFRFEISSWRCAPFTGSIGRWLDEDKYANIPKDIVCRVDPNSRTWETSRIYIDEMLGFIPNL